MPGFDEALVGVREAFEVVVTHVEHERVAVIVVRADGVDSMRRYQRSPFVETLLARKREEEYGLCERRWGIRVRQHVLVPTEAEELWKGLDDRWTLEMASGLNQGEDI